VPNVTFVGEAILGVDIIFKVVDTIFDHARQL
jgi:hypothetical protein